MTNLPLLLLLLAHLCGDYLFQSKRLAQRKLENWRAFGLHAGIYAFCMAVVLLVPVEWLWKAGVFLVLALGHAGIDAVKVMICRKRQARMFPKRELFLYITDQLLHLLFLLAAGWLLAARVTPGAAADSTVFAFLERPLPYDLLLIVLVALACWQPAAILVKKVLATLRPAGTQPQRTEGAGYLIGVLERGLVAFLILAGQLGAVGFVVAAKSLARFKQLEDKDFAENYLVGTMLSFLFAMVCAGLAGGCLR